MGMKKRGRGSEGEEAKKNLIINNSRKSLSIVMAAVLVSSVLIAFMPLAAANGNIDTFTIAPCRGNPSAESAYNVTINTTGFTSLDMTIPAGFKANQSIAGGELLAEAWVWDNESNEYYMTFTANGTDKIDLHCVCGGDEVNYTFDAGYDEGDSINISVSCYGSAYANLTLPTSTVNGSLKMSLGETSKKLTNVGISIKEFVRNPAACGPYTFDLTANGDSKSFTVCIMYPGDINGDSKVDVLDLQRLAWAFDSEPGDLNWNPCADLKCDGVINVLDLQRLAWNYLNVYPAC